MKGSMSYAKPVLIKSGGSIDMSRLSLRYCSVNITHQLISQSPSSDPLAILADPPILSRANNISQFDLASLNVQNRLDSPNIHPQRSSYPQRIPA